MKCEITAARSYRTILKGNFNDLQLLGPYHCGIAGWQIA